MGIVSGNLTVARFRVAGELAEGWREVYRDRLNEFAFHDPPQGQGKEEVEGWVQVHNLLDADFGDFNRWLYNDVLLVALRVDKKRLPARLFRATLEKRRQEWCAERDVERCPNAVTREIKEELEREWLKRTLPSVAVTEAAWSINGGWAVLHSLSEGMAERFRKRFFRTFGLKLLPWSPLDWLEDRTQVDALLSKAPMPVQLGGPEVRLAGGGSVA
ncbi:MAG: recombination-associated protein RdgC [Myxococcales bacterium]|nr:recombination-associated protein RdgC [Myxococcales bacterium]